MPMPGGISVKHKQKHSEVHGAIYISEISLFGTVLFLRGRSRRCRCGKGSGIVVSWLLLEPSADEVLSVTVFTGSSVSLGSSTDHN